jgi:enterochelin esterase family protein
MIAVLLAAIAAAVTFGSASGAPIPSGRVEEVRIPCRHDGRARRAWVYTPPLAPARPDTGLTLLIVFDGGEYTSEIPTPRILDSLLAAARIPPCVALMIDDSTRAARLDELANRAWFADYLAAEVVPWVRARHHVTRDPHRVILAGSSAGGLAATHAALRHPETFGNVLSQSGAFWRGNEASNDPPYEWLTRHVASTPRRDVRFWLEVGTTESRGALGGSAPSILAANRALRDALRAKGYRVAYAEVPNGVHGYETWGVRLAGGIVAVTNP